MLVSLLKSFVVIGGLNHKNRLRELRVASVSDRTIALTDKQECRQLLLDCSATAPLPGLIVRLLILTQKLKISFPAKNYQQCGIKF